MVHFLQKSTLSGETYINGDKSISHRALILAALANGTTTIKNLSNGKDVLSTINALKQLNVQIEHKNDICYIYGRGIDSLLEPNDVLQLANSGTGARLLIGLLSTLNFTSRIDGDASLRKCPMNRVTTPLSLTGGQFHYEKTNGNLPLTIHPNPYPINFTTEIIKPSAQVKTALMLAALNCPGENTIIERQPTRDHSERLFPIFGANIKVEQEKIKIKGLEKLRPANLTIAGDFSSAAFLIVAGLITENSKILIRDVGLNPTRTGLLKVLQHMGANITITNLQIRDNEPFGDIAVTSSCLKATSVDSELAPLMIDEFPILAIAASLAEGKSSFYGLKELRYKESDRLHMIYKYLNLLNIPLKRTKVKIDLYPSSLLDTPISFIIRIVTASSSIFLSLVFFRISITPSR